MVVGSSKNLPVGCNQKPGNFAEYTKVCSNIETKLLEIYNNENEEVIILVTLGNNYPNPFNPRTTISFSLPKESNCIMEVFNIKGQKVKTLLNDKQTKGNHKVVWNGTDDNGKSVSSGMYFYKLTTPERVITNKMIMLK